MTCKIADFGLSRSVKTEDDGSSEYYRSSNGVLPVRWTAPEGLYSHKFSTASDVWSFGITCVEIFQDGERPYPETKSLPDVMHMVNQGQVHPQPPDCSDGVYAELVKCWQSNPAERPQFASLKEFFNQFVVEETSSPERTSSMRKALRNSTYDDEQYARRSAPGSGSQKLSNDDGTYQYKFPTLDEGKPHNDHAITAPNAQKRDSDAAGGGSIYTQLATETAVDVQAMEQAKRLSTDRYVDLALSRS